MDQKSPKNRNYLIIRNYILGLLCLGLYFLMNDSSELNELLLKVDNFNSSKGFLLYVIAGVIKLASLVVGLSVPLIQYIFSCKAKNEQ